MLTNDFLFVKGSRDNHVALWCIKDEEESGSTSRMKSLQVPEYVVTKPIIRKSCKKAEKVRALAVNEPAKVKLYFNPSESDAVIYKALQCKVCGMLEILIVSEK